MGKRRTSTDGPSADLSGRSIQNATGARASPWKLDRPARLRGGVRVSRRRCPRDREPDPPRSWSPTSPARRVPSSAYSVMTTVPSSRKTASEYAPPNGVGPSARSTLTRRRGAPGRPAPAASWSDAAGRFRVTLQSVSELDAVLGHLLVERSRNELARAAVPSRPLVGCLATLRQDHNSIAESLGQRDRPHVGLGGWWTRSDASLSPITRARHAKNSRSDSCTPTTRRRVPTNVASVTSIADELVGARRQRNEGPVSCPIRCPSTCLRHPRANAICR